MTDRGLGSRKTIYKDLGQLVEDGYIEVVKQKPNSQRHPLYINSDSILRSFMDDLAILEDSFIKLIDQVKKNLPSALFETDLHDFEQYKIQILDDIHDSKIDHIMEPLFSVSHIYSSLRRLFEHMCAIFLLYFLVEWPKKVANNNKILDKLYSSTFQSIRKIRTEMSKSLPGIEVLYISQLKQDLVNRLFILKSDELYWTITTLKNNGLNEQTEDVVDALWKVSSPFAPSFEHVNNDIVERVGKEIHLVKDWRNVVGRRKRFRRVT